MLKTNYRISKNLKVVLAALLLCAQFLLIVSDAFSFEQEHFISNEVCTESTLIELPNALLQVLVRARRNNCDRLIENAFCILLFLRCTYFTLPDYV